MYIIQTGDGEDDPQLGRCLFRLNVGTKDWGITYMTHPMYEDLRGATWLVDSLMPDHLAVAQGWTDSLLADYPDRNWGWGLQTRIKDFHSARLKTIVIPNIARRVIEATNYTAHTVLLRGRSDDPIGGITKMYLGRPMGFDPNMEWKRVEVTKQQGNAESCPGAPLEDLAKLRKRLEEEIQRTTGPRQDPEKTQFNLEDSSSIPEGAALADGGKPLATRHLS